MPRSTKAKTLFAGAVVVILAFLINRKGSPTPHATQLVLDDTTEQEKVPLSTASSHNPETSSLEIASFADRQEQPDKGSLKAIVFATAALAIGLIGALLIPTDSVDEQVSIRDGFTVYFPDTKDIRQLTVTYSASRLENDEGQVESQFRIVLDYRGTYQQWQQSNVPRVLLSAEPDFADSLIACGARRLSEGAKDYETAVEMGWPKPEGGSTTVLLSLDVIVGALNYIYVCGFPGSSGLSHTSEYASFQSAPIQLDLDYDGGSAPPLQKTSCIEFLGPSLPFGYRVLRAYPDTYGDDGAGLVWSSCSRSSFDRYYFDNLYQPGVRVDYVNDRQIQENEDRVFVGGILLGAAAGVAAIALEALFEFLAMRRTKRWGQPS